MDKPKRKFKRLVLLSDTSSDESDFLDSSYTPLSSTMNSVYRSQATGSETNPKDQMSFIADSSDTSEDFADASHYAVKQKHSAVPEKQNVVINSDGESDSNIVEASLDDSVRPADGFTASTPKAGGTKIIVHSDNLKQNSHEVCKQSSEVHFQGRPDEHTNNLTPLDFSADSFCDRSNKAESSSTNTVGVAEVSSTNTVGVCEERHNLPQQRKSVDKPESVYDSGDNRMSANSISIESVSSNLGTSKDFSHLNNDDNFAVSPEKVSSSGKFDAESKYITPVHVVNTIHDSESVISVGSDESSVDTAVISLLTPKNNENTVKESKHRSKNSSANVSYNSNESSSRSVSSESSKNSNSGGTMSADESKGLEKIKQEGSHSVFDLHDLRKNLPFQTVEGAHDDSSITEIFSPLPDPLKKSKPSEQHIKNCSVNTELESQNDLKKKVASLEADIAKSKLLLRTANIMLLPDRGVRMQMAITEKEKALKILKEKLQTHPEKRDSGVNFPQKSVKERIKESFEEERTRNSYQDGSLSHAPVKNGINAYGNTVPHRMFTIEGLEVLYKSLETRPADNIFEDDPISLKSNIQLMLHQKHALSWLLWRERQKPRGGILADDMGLGKTLTMISLILKSKEENVSKSSESDDSESETEEEVEGLFGAKKKKWRKGGTLVVCPASLLNQWENEIRGKCKSGVLSTSLYHDSSRETSVRRLSEYDVVITTYGIVRSEAGASNIKHSSKKQGLLHRIKWERIILDEAHIVRNHKNKTCVAVCELRGKYRWALTGTPLHNRELDVYALLKFLQCSPFDDLLVWRRWVDNKNASGMYRLNTIMNAVMLRRTKEQLQDAGSLQCLPKKNLHVISIKLSKEEFAVYETLLNYSRTLFAQFLYQRAEREEQNGGDSIIPLFHTNKGKNAGAGDLATVNKELAAMHNHVNGMKDVKTFEILTLLLRLRQTCCHPGLIHAMLEKESKEADGIEDECGLDIDLLSKLGNLSLMENPENSEEESSKDCSEKKVLVTSNPVFDFKRSSSKMQAIFDKLSETVLNSDDKAIIISQWTSMLEIIGDHLSEMGVKCARLTGTVPIKERINIVDSFNQNDRGPKIMLLSLTAGGVGLNLVGANHLFLFDLHWNPQLEAQACDRIYRVGQKKEVHIYKFICEETIEERIKKMQDQKLSLASGVLTGVKQKHSQKLSLDDLRTLFGL